MTEIDHTHEPFSHRYLSNVGREFHYALLLTTVNHDKVKIIHVDMERWDAGKSFERYMSRLRLTLTLDDKTVRMGILEVSRRVTEDDILRPVRDVATDFLEAVLALAPAVDGGKIERVEVDVYSHE